MSPIEIDRRCRAIEQELADIGFPERPKRRHRRWSVAALALLIPLSGCRSMIPDHVSLKDIEPRKINKPAPSKATAFPIVLAPVTVIAPTVAIGSDLEARVAAELSGRGYPISQTGTYRIMGAVTDAPPAVTWTIIDGSGAKVGTVKQSNPTGNIAESTHVIASTAADSIVKLLATNRSAL